MAGILIHALLCLGILLCCYSMRKKWTLKKEIIDANLVLVRESVKKKEYVSYATKSFQNSEGLIEA